MRDFLNGILSFIVAESLTDLEWATVTSTIPIYDQESYDDLSRVLLGRDNVSNYQERLLSFYTAKGVTISKTVTARSNIFLGAAL